MNAPSAQKTSGLAITSLVLGILSMICCGLFTGIGAIIFGHVSQAKIRNSNGRLSGEGLAIAGFILGYLSIFTTAILAALAIPAFSAALIRGQLTQDLSNAKQIHLAMEQMALDGQTTGDKSLGYPADAGITSVSALKARLVEKEYLSADDVAALKWEKFLIGNTSASDPAATIVIRSRPEFSKKGFIIMQKSGDGRVLTNRTPVSGEKPPREPAWLAP